MTTRNKTKINILSTALLMTSALFLTQQNVSAKSQPYSIKTVPKNGLNVDWPILNERQYFTYKGKNARVVTLRAVIHFDCQKLTELYGQDPRLALNELELFLLTQYALRGMDIQTMGFKNREELAISEVAKRLRQFGRVKETQGLFKKPRVAPTVAALCQILEKDKEDLLRQEYHLRHQWDRYKVSVGTED